MAQSSKDAGIREAPCSFRDAGVQIEVLDQEVYNVYTRGD